MLFGCTVRLPNERCFPASASPRKVALGSVTITRSIALRSPLYELVAAFCKSS